MNHEWMILPLELLQHNKNYLLKKTVLIKILMTFCSCLNALIFFILGQKFYISMQNIGHKIHYKRKDLKLGSQII